MREFLPHFYRKAEIDWGFADPTFGYRLGGWPIESKVYFDGVEDLRVIFQLIEALTFHVGIKGAKPAFGWRAGIGITRRTD